MTTNSNGSYTQFPSPMKSYLFSILAIVAAAVPGASLAWITMTSMGLTGVSLALSTVFGAMVLAVAFFALLVAVGRALNLVK